MKKIIALILALIFSISALAIPASAATAQTTKTQYRYHAYVGSNGKRFICPAAGLQSYPGTTFALVYTEWMDHPLTIDNGSYSHYVHTKTSACEQSGCIDCSYRGNRYRDTATGLTWFVEETRTVPAVIEGNTSISKFLALIRKILERNKAKNKDIICTVPYTSQSDGAGCYIASSVMLINAYRQKNGEALVSYYDVKKANNNSTWFSWSTPEKFGLSDVDIVRSAENLSAEEKFNRIVTSLKAGNAVMTCFRNNGDHMIVIIGVRADGALIVHDPARNGLGGESIKLTDSKYLTSKTGTTNQMEMLEYLAFATIFEPLD